MNTAYLIKEYSNAPHSGRNSFLLLTTTADRPFEMIGNYFEIKHKESHSLFPDNARFLQLQSVLSAVSRMETVWTVKYSMT